MQSSQYLLLFPSIYPLFLHCDTPRIYSALPQYTLFYTHICDTPRIYSFLPEYIPPFLQLYATLPESTPPSQNMASFSITICDPLRIYPSLLGYTPLVYNYIRRSQSLPLPPRIYSFFYYYMRRSQNLLLPPRIYPHF